MALWLVRAGRYGEHEQRFFRTTGEIRAELPLRRIWTVASQENDT